MLRISRLIPVLMLTAILSVRSPVQTQDVAQNQATGETSLLKVAFVSNRAGNNEIYVMTAEGRNQENLTKNSGADDREPAWTADGREIGFSTDRDGNREIYTIDYDYKTSRNLTNLPDSNETWPAFSPDGSRLAFVSDMARIGTYDIYVFNLASKEISRITTDQNSKYYLAWTPDSASLLYTEENDGVQQVKRVTVASRGERLIAGIGKQNTASISSADSRCVIVQSNRDVKWRLFEMRDNGDLPRPIDTGDGNAGMPSLSPDGTTLLYVTDAGPSDDIMAIDVTLECAGDSRTASEPRALTNAVSADFSPVWQPKVPPSRPSIEQNAPDDSGSGLLTQSQLLATGAGQADQGAERYFYDALDMGKLLSLTNVAEWHGAGWRGEGQRIAVFDVGFKNLSNLSSSIMDGKTVSYEDTAPDILDDDSHGTNVLEIIYTLAPNAELYACRYLSLEQLDRCVNWAISNSVQIVNHSVGYPMLNQDNPISTAVNRARQEGILWINSAGNFANGFLEGTGADANADGYQDFGSEVSVLEIKSDRGYRGNVMLAWNQEVDDPLIPPDIGFELEFVDSATTLEPLPPASIKAFVRESMFQRALLIHDRSFGIRVRPTSPLTPNQFRNFRVALFVEFSSFENSQANGSVLAPGGSSSLITVGAVVSDTMRLADFSSYGVFGSTRNTPDLVAPGAIFINNPTDQHEKLFVGTSASAPVVAGAAVLVWQAHPDYDIDAISTYLKTNAVSKSPDARRDQATGAGPLALPEPPLNTGQIEVQNVPPYVVFYIQPPAGVPLASSCPGALPQRLEDGIQGFILKNLDILGGLRLRSLPTTQGNTQLAQLAALTRFSVIGGPECAESMNWWQVQLADGTTGWMAEGAIDLAKHNNGGYLLAPDTLDRAVYPRMESITPCNAPPSQLQVGARAVIILGGMTVYQEIEQKHEYRYEIERGAEVAILGGPRCEGGNDRIRRWYLRVMTGDQSGLEGWVAENMPAERFMEIRQQAAATPTLIGPTPTSIVLALTQGIPVPTAVPTATAAPLVSAISCEIRFRDRINTRRGPGTEYDIVRANDRGVRLNAVGQAVDSLGNVWWRLLDRSWVRSDTVRERGESCSNLPLSGPDLPVLALNMAFPLDRSAPPSSAHLLNGGRGMTDGSIMNGGEVQVGYYCAVMGYFTANDSNHWFCQTGDGDPIFSLEAVDFDFICQATYSKSEAFAIQDGDGQPAYRWRCYE